MPRGYFKDVLALTHPNCCVLLISCPDRRGLVAGLAQTLHGHGCNILDSDQHTDVAQGSFFQRIVFDTSEQFSDEHALVGAIEELATRFSMSYRLTRGGPKKRVAILVSQLDHCLVDLLWRHRAGELVCEIPVIISNHAAAQEIAQQFGVEFHQLPITPENKPEQEAKMLELLAQHKIDVVVLARYMQVLSAEFCAKMAGKIINIHHSFLPAFVGGKPYHQAHTRGVKLIGATAHYVTPELDEGPIIEQDVTRTTHRDDVEDLVRKGRDLERLVLARALRVHLEERVIVHGHKTVVFGE